MDTERQRGNDLGPTGQLVGRNVARYRGESRVSLKELSERMHDIGRPISISAISKLENGTRRVDADDLVALSIALGVTPISLLFPEGGEGDGVVDVYGATVTETDLWEWAAARSPLDVNSTRAEAERFRARARPWWTNFLWAAVSDESLPPRFPLPSERGRDAGGEAKNPDK